LVLWKAHGLGNDYLVLEAGPPVNAAAIAAICDRHRGAGSDGLLVPTPSTRADFGVRIFNPDGSVAEKSGNGLRIFATWCRRVRGAPARFSVDTGYDVVDCQDTPEGFEVAIGQASFAPERVPVAASAPLIEHPVEVLGARLHLTALSLANPHCVVFLEGDLDAHPWEAWGRALEGHPLFPRRTNVQFAQVLGPGRLRLRIFERGVGPTLASGTSACAALAAAVATGRAAPGAYVAEMQGGELAVRIGDEGLTLRGPVGEVGRILLDPRVLPPD
jgi:diaminopimelate epimerase